MKCREKAGMSRDWGGDLWGFCGGKGVSREVMSMHG